MNIFEVTPLVSEKSKESYLSQKLTFDDNA